nr:hypothetical protein TetV2_00609 [Oceanusvirus sp.]
MSSDDESMNDRPKNPNYRYSNKHYQANKDDILQAKKEFYRANKDKIKEKNRLAYEKTKRLRKLGEMVESGRNAFGIED